MAIIESKQRGIAKRPVVGTPTALGSTSMRQYTLSEFRPDGTVESDRVFCPTCGDGFEKQYGMRVHHGHVHGEKLRDTIECATCGIEFEESVNRSNQTYCSPECQAEGLRERVTLECGICGDEFDIPPSAADTRRHCSKDCFAEWVSERTGEAAANWRGGKVTKHCPVCGGEYEAWPHEADDRVVCSPSCRYEWYSLEYSGENHPRWNGGKVTKACPICGDEYSLYPSGHETYSTCRSEECTYRYQSRILSGENHPRWNGGGSRGFITTIKNTLAGDRTWQSIANTYRESRGSRCDHCGRSPTEDERALSAHHIVPIRAGGSHVDELLMVLCNSCHPKIEAYTWSIPEITPVLTEFE